MPNLFKESTDSLFVPSKIISLSLMMNKSRVFFIKVLVESEQMRKEADDTGPMAEVEHWRQRMGKFNSLVEQVKTKKCKSVIGILIFAKSKVLKVSQCTLLSRDVGAMGDYCS